MKMSLFLDPLKGPLGGFDSARILFAVGGFAGIVYQGIALYKGQAWAPIEFFTGLGAYLSGGGLGISLKDKGVASANNTTTPQPPSGGQP